MHRLFSIALLLVVGCGGGDKPKTRDDVVKAYGAKLQPRMAQLVEVGKQAVAAANEPPGEAGQGPAGLDVDHTDHKGNGVVVQVDDLEDLAKDAAPELRLIDKDNDSVRIAKTFAGPATIGLQAGDWGIFEPHLNAVIDAKYAVVVVIQNVKLPALSLGGTEFTPGSVDAQAVLVEIEGAKPHGSVKVTATSSGEVMTKRVSGMGASEELQRKLAEDLRGQLGKTLSEAIRKRWPGANAPYHWGGGW